MAELQLLTFISFDTISSANIKRVSKSSHQQKEHFTRECYAVIILPISWNKLLSPHFTYQNLLNMDGPSH